VFRKGPKNHEPYEEGQWVLVEHGRWTRGLNITIGDVERNLRMVEAESILGYSENQPEDAIIGTEYNDGPADIRPEEFHR